MGDICTAKFKTNIKQLTKWYQVQLEKLPIDIHLNTTITGDEEILKTCDYIIVSTGALPFTPAIPGIDGDNVVNIVEAHRNESLIKGNKIVVCGGGASGLDGAIEMAEEMHKDVTVVEKHLEADTIISAFGMRPNTKLADQLKEKYPMKTRVIGDCYKLGKIGEAVREGFFAASSLD